MKSKRDKIYIFLIDFFVLAYYVLFQLVHFISNGTNIAGIILIIPILIALVLFYSYKHPKLNFKFTKILILQSFFVLFCLFSCIWAENSDYAWSMTINVFELFIVFCILYYIYSSNNNMKSLLNIMMFGGYILDFIVLMFFGWNSFFEILNGGSRMETDLINANYLGITTSFSILINIYRIVIKREIKLYDLLIIFGVIILAFSASRKAIVMTVFGTIFILLFGLIIRFNTKKLFPYILLVISFVGIFIFISNLQIFNLANDRIESLLSYFTDDKMADGSTLARMKLNEIGYELFSTKPILGYGIDNAKIYGNAYFHTTEYYLHNNFIELLADVGILGFLIYYSVYFVIIYRLFKNFNFKNEYFILTFLMLILSLIIDFGSVTYSSKQTAFVLLIMWLSTEKLVAEKSNCYSYSFYLC